MNEDNVNIRAVKASEKKYGKRNDDISVIQRAAFQEGYIERDSIARQQVEMETDFPEDDYYETQK